MVSKNLSVAKFDLNYLRTGEIESAELNNYQDLHHLQGGMKFATQISPLLNFIY